MRIVAERQIDRRFAADLVADSLQGETESLGRLVELAQPLVFNLAQKFYLSPQDAEDASQEILIKLITRLDRFDPDRGTFRAWVLGIARNHLLDTRRKLGRMESQITSIEGYFDALDAVPDERIRDTSRLGPEDRSIALEANASCLLGMLLCLDREQRLVLIVGDVLSIPAPEAAAVFDLTAATFRQKLSRARKDLYSFMDLKCGLVNSANPCRCYRKAKGFAAAGWIDPEKRVWTDTLYENARVFADGNAEPAFDSLDSAYAEQFTGLPQYDADRSVVDIEQILSNPQVRRLFHFE